MPVFLYLVLLGVGPAFAEEPTLDGPAAEEPAAANKWKFKPYLVDGVATSFQVKLKLKFRYN
jgi:hypothetical protein